MVEEVATITPEIVAEAPAVTPDVAPVIESAPGIIPEAIPESAEVKPAETMLGKEAPVEVAEVTKEEAPLDALKEQEGSQSDEPAPLPTYEEFTAPEGFNLDPERIGDFTNALAEFEVKTKADHAEVQALGQQLVERHVAEVKNAVDQYTTSLLDQFEAQKNEWKEKFENDPEIGGNKKDTTVSAALEFIRTHGGSSEQQTEFHQLMEQTGVGNHPAMIRMLAAANRAYSEGKPLPASRPAPQVKSKLDKFYGGSM